MSDGEKSAPPRRDAPSVKKKEFTRCSAPEATGPVRFPGGPRAGSGQPRRHGGSHR